MPERRGVKQFAAIVRFVRHREATGPAKDIMEPNPHATRKLCKRLVDYETKSEIIGMMEFVQRLKGEPPQTHVRAKGPQRDFVVYSGKQRSMCC